VADGVTLSDAIAAWQAEIVHAREHCAGRSLTDNVHMIEEYARHNGHADLLRERIEGVTGA
jgi:hypothetical protein